MTDVLFCLLFLAHLGLFLVIGGSSIANGQPERLVSGQDWQGNFCGVSGQKTDAGVDLEKYPVVYYAMNVSPIVKKVAGDVFGSSYDSGNPSQLKNNATQSLDPEDMYSGSKTANGMVSSLTTYFVPVCMAACPKTQLPADVVDSSYRSYVWEGPLDTETRPNFIDYRDQAVGPNADLMDPFTFRALPETACPYDPKYCVPMQYLGVQTIMSKYCVPQVAVFSAANEHMKDVVPDSFGEALNAGFGDMIGDLKKAWPAILITAVCSLVIAMLFLWVLRLCVGVFVWVAIGVSGILMLFVGAGGILYANKCTGDSIFATGSGITSGGSEALQSAIKGKAECTQGFSISDPTIRDALRYISYVLFGLTGVYLLLVICLCKRIRLGIAINKVAAQFVGNNKSALLVPIVQAFLAMLWWALWVVVAIFTVSHIPDGTRDLVSEWTVLGKAIEGCGDSRSNVYAKRVDFTNDAAPETVYACKEARYVMNAQFFYEFFSLLWTNAFVVACGQCIIAGAVGVWYFTPNTDKGSLGTKAVRRGVFNTLVYHLGTMAFGSLVLAVVQAIKWFLRYLAQQSKQSKNKTMEAVFKALSCVIACFERCLKFLNKNAYIQTALMGTKFCVSAKIAFFLILRNAARIGVLGGIGGAVNFLGLGLITAATTLIGWVLLTTMYDGELASPIFPLVLFGIIGFVVASLVMNVFRIAVDAVLQCFVADEEMNKYSGGAQCTPEQLRTFMVKQGASRN